MRYGGRPVLTYNAAADLPEGLEEHYRRSGFFHPVYSPNGKVVTDGFPAGYAHHHGIFTAWTKTRFRGREVDFWNTQKGLATVCHRTTERLDTTSDGPTGFTVTLEHIALLEQPVTVLREELDVRLHDRSDVFAWDLTSRQENVSQDTLYLLEHVYGGLGVRGNKTWNAADSLHYTQPASFLTDEGSDRENGNHTRPEWTAMFGEVEGESAGLVVLPHLENMRYPQPVRLHPHMPYFSVSPVVIGDTAIAPGATLTNRYRVVTFDGEVPTAALETLRW